MTPWELPERIRDKFAVDLDTGCWLWRKTRTSGGYGRLKFRGRMHVAHRLIYTLLLGDPGGRHLDHLCRVRRCVNPGHLEPVTPRENLLRGDTHAARNSAKTHCDHGHAFTPANTHWEKKAGGGLGRRCRKCAAERARAKRRSR